MPKNSGGFYAVHKGRQTGVFLTWNECEQQTKGFSGAVFKKFSTMQEARNFAARGNPNKPAKAQTKSKPAANIHSVYVKEAVDEKHIVPRTGNARPAMGAILTHRDAVHVYTDGACPKNGQGATSAGIGVWFADGSCSLSEPLKEREIAPTNNRAEYTAVIRALETLEYRAIPTSRPVIIYSDSNLLINTVLTWMDKWKRNGWKTNTGDVKNRDLIERIDSLLNRLGRIVYFHHIKGHAGIKGNEEADRLAVQGAAKC